MSNIFNVFLYQPVFHSLVFIYQNLSFQDLGLAIIILTALVRIVLFPLFYKSAKHQAIMQRLQPKVKEIQEKHKNDKTKQGAELMNLYKEHKINPFSGILVLIIQLPIIIAIYQVILKETTKDLFSNFMLLGLFNLREANIAIAVIASALQYLQMRLSFPPEMRQGGKNNPAAQTGKIMLIMGPAFSLLILSRLPSALGLYWLASTVFSIGQQILVNKKISGSNKTLKLGAKT